MFCLLAINVFASKLIGLTIIMIYSGVSKFYLRKLIERPEGVGVGGEFAM